MKTTDADVGKYLGMFTFLRKEQIHDIMEQHEVR
jgi:tyrosyl-tRNA synthetase